MVAERVWALLLPGCVIVAERCRVGAAVVSGVVGNGGPSVVGSAVAAGVALGDAGCGVLDVVAGCAVVVVADASFTTVVVSVCAH